MSTTFIVLCVFGFVGLICVIAFYAHKVDTLTTDNGILKRRNETLEERFAQEDEQASIAAALPKTGVEILQTFAQSHQIKLEPSKDFNDDDWELYFFSYQGGYFYSYVSKHSDEVLIRYGRFNNIPYSDDAHIRVLRLCDEYTANRRYVKLTHSVEKNDMGEDEIQFHFYYDLIGVSQAGLEHLLNHTFNYAREASGLIEDIRKELEALHPADTNKPKTEADYQAMAIKMAMSRDNK